MNKQSEKAYGVGRLESKTARAAIIQKIATDFNLMPIIAEAYYKQISLVLFLVFASRLVRTALLRLDSDGVMR